MPIIKSARKRVKVTAAANLRNAKTKRSMREAIKAFSKVLNGGKPAEITEAQTKAVRAIDQAVKKAVIHKNKAARTKARLAAQAKAAGVKPVKAAVKKVPATKKPAAKSSAKTSAKKTPAKKAK